MVKKWSIQGSVGGYTPSHNVSLMLLQGEKMEYSGVCRGLHPSNNVSLMLLQLDSKCTFIQNTLIFKINGEIKLFSRK